MLGCCSTQSLLLKENEMNTYRAYFKIPDTQAIVVLEIRANFGWEADDAAKLLESKLGLKFIMWFEGE